MVILVMIEALHLKEFWGADLKINNLLNKSYININPLHSSLHSETKIIIIDFQLYLVESNITQTHKWVNKNVILSNIFYKFNELKIVFKFIS